MLLKLFYEIDNFCKAFVRFWQKFVITQGLAKRIKPCRLCLSEIMTILVNFHMSRFRTFKDYYIKHVCVYLRKEFPGLVSYNRFVERTQVFDTAAPQRQYPSRVPWVSG